MLKCYRRLISVKLAVSHSVRRHRKGTTDVKARFTANKYSNIVYSCLIPNIIKYFEQNVLSSKQCFTNVQNIVAERSIFVRGRFQ